MKELPDHKARGVGNDVYGPARLALAAHVQRALDALGAVWFLDAGTLLGAFRNGKLIPHDDDFDLAVYVPSFGAAALRELAALDVPARYRTRVVATYAQKVEVFDPGSERFVLPSAYGGADFHTVTVDLQIMTDAADGTVVYLHDMLDHVRVPRDALTPTGHIECEGHRFRAPHDIERFLQAQYGYLGSDARYDPDTKLYVKA